MARMQIEITGKKLSEHFIPVRITDINYGNHTGNDKIAGLIHEARVQCLQSFGLTELKIGDAALIMVDLSIQFLKETFYGDVLKFEIFADEIDRSRFELLYLITVADTIVAKAKTTMVCFDYTSRKIAAMPERFKMILTD